MPNLEYDIPMSIETPEGTVLLNVADPVSGEIYIVRFEEYEIIPSLRVTQDNISQADGSVLHTRYKTGLVARMRVSYYVRESGTDQGADSKPACGAQLREMHEFLILCLNSIKSLDPDPLAVQRYHWSPTGYSDTRLLDNVQILSWPEPSYDLGGIEVSVTFSIESPFPYAIDATEIITHGGSDPAAPFTGTVTINNAGNSAQSPVAKISATGPSVSFSLANNSDVDSNGDPKQIVYDSTLPGGAAIPVFPSYAEIDFFRGTIFLNGDGADLIASLDPAFTDFWVLVPGDNEVVLTNAQGIILSNNAWA